MIKLAVNNGGYYTFEGFFEINPYSIDKTLTISLEGKYRVILSLLQNYFNSINTSQVGIEDENSISYLNPSSIRLCENKEDETSLNSVHIQAGDQPSMSLRKNSYDIGINMYVNSDKSYITKDNCYVLGQKVLYNNVSGTNGTVTLSETSANFEHLEIFYRDDWNEKQSTKVSSPNGATAKLNAYRIIKDASTAFFREKLITITGALITNNRIANYTTWDNNTSDITNNIYIYKIIGYK